MYILLQFWNPLYPKIGENSISQSNLISGCLLNVAGRRVFAQKRAGKLFCVFVSEHYLYMERDRRVMVWSKTWRSMEAPKLRQSQSPYVLFHVYVSRKDRVGRLKAIAGHEFH